LLFVNIINELCNAVLDACKVIVLETGYYVFFLFSFSDILGTGFQSLADLVSCHTLSR